MMDFSYTRARSIDEARDLSIVPAAMLLAGGTTLLDLAKCGVVEPTRLIDITHIENLDTITVTDSGAAIGALAKMSRVADDPRIRENFPAISESLSLAASAQLRNMATVGGNLLQRTRCAYFRDPATFPACNKRAPGSGCAAVGGVTRNHAVLGTSDACIATYPGDLAVALVAFDAVIHIGPRAIPADEFFLLPGATPHREVALLRGEMITEITIPASPAARRSTYLKIRDRQSYEFAAASAAVGLDLAPDGRTITDIRIALGGVATIPWRCHAAEEALRGEKLDPETIARASALAMQGADARGANRYKIDLAARVVARAILKTGEIS
ncbi:MAG TPA: xanthine dehydrogenase family protein subunit M [Acetobacteraceae bacterium]|nr:xanthine dehydrogenase family protein subunit M [Acetobacteraceae bacterium]